EPECGDNYLNRANVRSRLGRHQEALFDYTQVRKLSPNDSNNAWTAAWAHFGQEGLSEAAVQELERIAVIDPSHYTSACCLGVIALHHSDIDTALAYFEQAASLEPTQWDPPFWTAMGAAMRGEMEVARQAIEYALELGLP